jgi:hypothetical protein
MLSVMAPLSPKLKNYSNWYNLVSLKHPDNKYDVIPALTKSRGLSRQGLKGVFSTLSRRYSAFFCNKKTLVFKRDVKKIYGIHPW